MPEHSFTTLMTLTSIFKVIILISAQTKQHACKQYDAVVMCCQQGAKYGEFELFLGFGLLTRQVEVVMI